MDDRYACRTARHLREETQTDASRMGPVCPKTVRRRMDRAGRRRRTRPPGTTGFQKSPRSIAVPGRTHHTSTTQTIMNKTRRQPVILEWTDTQLALLGSMSDSRVAELLGISCRTVGAQRVKRGISASGQTTDEKRHRWKKRQLAWLGNLTDTEVARRLGLSAPTVRAKRMSLGRPPAAGATNTSQRIWKKRDLKRLGRVPDQELAAWLGITRQEVVTKRQEFGIPSYAEQAQQTRWTPERLARLGEVADSQLAREIGITTSAVGELRRRRGIGKRSLRSARKTAE